MLRKLLSLSLLIFTASSPLHAEISGDFRTESDLPYCCDADGPLVYEALGVPVGDGYELSGGDYVENPSGWGGGVVFMDVDVSGLLSLDSQDTWDFERFVATITGISGTTVQGIELVSGNITDKGITPTLTFTEDSITIVYDDGSVFNFNNSSALFQIIWAKLAGREFAPSSQTLAPDLLQTNIMTCGGNDFVSGILIIGHGQITKYVDYKHRDACFDGDVIVLPEGVMSHDIAAILAFLGSGNFDVYAWR